MRISRLRSPFFAKEIEAIPIEIKLKALGKRAFVQLGKSSTHTGMNE
jgi:hypothetical protein